MRKREEKKREEENKNKSTTNFQPTIQRMAIRPISFLETISPTTGERMKSQHQSESTTHPEEDQTFNSVDKNPFDFNADVIYIKCFMALAMNRSELNLKYSWNEKSKKLDKLNKSVSFEIFVNLLIFSYLPNEKLAFFISNRKNRSFVQIHYIKTEQFTLN